jgi:hypothetical protein
VSGRLVKLAYGDGFYVTHCVTFPRAMQGGTLKSQVLSKHTVPPAS